MASRRKSSTPCMVPPQESLGLDQEMEDLSASWDPESSNGAEEAARLPHAGAAEGGYECKYCSFQTAQLNLFTVHVDTEHPDVVLNTSYVCLECDFHTRSYDTLQAHNARSHPGEDNFTRTMVKRNKETVFQQTVSVSLGDGDHGLVLADQVQRGADQGLVLGPEAETRSQLDAGGGASRRRRRRAQVQAAGWLRCRDARCCCSLQVEEARRKKFNGTVQTAPPTITVIPAGIAASGLPPLFQTCQIVGQPGLVLTQVAASASPLTLTVAGLPGNQPKAAEPAATESRTEMSAGASLGSDPAAGKPKKSKEQLAELKASYSRRQFASEEEISRLMQVTQLSKRAIKKWFSDTRYNQRNSREHAAALLGASPTRRPAAGRGGHSAAGGGGSLHEADSQADGNAPIVIDSSDDASDASPTSAGAPAPSGPSGDLRVKFRHAFPDFTPQKFKEKTAEQLLVLEASFQRSDTPSDEELSRLRAQTKLTRREVDAWFTERRKASAATPPKDADPEGEGPRTKAGACSTPEGPATPPGGRKILKKTPEQLHTLKKAFVRTQWPTADEYEQLSRDTGLPRTYIVNWFGDTRYACKNSNLKWFYLYQSGKVDEALNGGTKTQKKSRKRFRGWSRRTRRPYACKRSPQGGAAAIKVKSGSEFLKDYYLKHRGLSERDLDDLVAKSSMSYEQVRDWFSRTSRRAQEGQELFSEEDVEAE
ncbi:unnamed protein product, partial [Tetraodon nigroviridis]